MPLVDTRLSLHAVAEHVVARARYLATGRIGLRVVPGGFGAPPFDVAGDRRELLVVGDLVIIRDDRGERGEAITTLRAAAAFAGVDLDAPFDVYHFATDPEPDRPLPVDVDEADGLAAWFGLTDEALRAFVSSHADDDPAAIQLWPEHFDLATTLAEVNVGGSPGDAEHDEPYLYVGPWSPPPPDEFWNEPFGASVSRSQLTGAADAVAFFDEGWRRLEGLRAR